MAESSYSARHLTVLEGLEAVRKRPGMYIGTTDSRGLMHCLWEIIDNSVDEALAGHGSSIRITLHGDGSVTVADDGRGVPVDIEPRSGLSGVELVFTKLHAGGKFGGGGYASSGGLHGVGASVVNALSSRLDVEVDRDGKTWAMSFRHGEPGVFAGEGPNSDVHTVRPSHWHPVNRQGEEGRHWHAGAVLGGSADLPLDRALRGRRAHRRARQTAFLVTGLTIEIEDQRPESLDESGAPAFHSFNYEGGIAEFVNFLAVDAPVTDTWRVSDSGKFTETVPGHGREDRPPRLARG